MYFYLFFVFFYFFVWVETPKFVLVCIITACFFSFVCKMTWQILDLLHYFKHLCTHKQTYISIHRNTVSRLYTYRVLLCNSGMIHSIWWQKYRCIEVRSTMYNANRISKIIQYTYSVWFSYTMTQRYVKNCCKCCCCCCCVLLHTFCKRSLHSYISIELLFFFLESVSIV